MDIKGIKNIKKSFKDETSAFKKQLQLKQLEKYASIIDMVLTDYNKKSCEETMMIKGYRRSSQETTIRKTHMENHAAMVSIAASRIGLNEKIASLMSKHHDIGHTFLGHSGEWWISNIKEDYGIGYYTHNALGVVDLEYTNQALKEIIEKIKFNYPGISAKEVKRIQNSLWLILEAINSHNGEVTGIEFFPQSTKTEADYKQEVQKCFTIKKFDRTIIPATPEACLMRLCDKISYIPSDMVDGLREGFISELDEEYIQILTKIGIRSEEIRQANITKEYDAIAKKLKDIFLEDLIQNSSKKKIAMSEKMSTLMYQLLDKNNREIVDWVVLQEDLDVYPPVIKTLMNRYKDILEQEQVVEKLPNACEDEELNIELKNKYKETPDAGFVRYICSMNPNNFNYIKWTVTKATRQSVQDELKMAREIVKNNKKEELNEFPMKQKRVHAYVQYYQDYFSETKKYYECQERLEVERAMQNIEIGRCNQNYITIQEGIELEIAARYLATLNDREFMDLIQDTKLITQEQYKSLTRKYKDFDFRKEKGEQTNWNEISKMHKNAARKDRER